MADDIMQHRTGLVMRRRLWHFVRGMGSAIEVWPAERQVRIRIVSEETDADALRRDWEMLGQDMWESIDEVARERAEHAEATPQAT